MRIQLQDAAVAGSRFVELALLLQGVAQIVLGGGGVRPEFQCPTEAGHRFAQAAQGHQGIAQIEMVGNGSPIQANCPTNAFDGNRVFARLVGNHSEEMDGVGMVRLGGEDLPVDLLGRLQPASLVVLDRKGQGLGGCGHIKRL